MPPENIIRLFELGKEYGRYPVDIDKIESTKGFLKNDQSLENM